MDNNSHSKQLRIGIIIASLTTGGAERMALALAQALLTNGIDIRLYLLDTERSMPLPGNKEEQEALERRIKVLDDHIGERSTLAKALAFPKLHHRLERSVHAEKLDLVISFMERANILNLLGNQKIPRIISIRKHLSMGLSDKDPLKRVLVKYGYSWLLKRASNINFNSSEAAQDLSALYPSNKVPVSVINNFYDENMLQRASAPLTVHEQALLEGRSIVTCGRLVPVKSHAALIRAFAPVAANVAGSKLIIVGGGPLKEKLESLIDTLKLRGRVFLTGQKTNPYPWVSKGKVFILSSKSEGFPNALLEAMALGRPVISTDCHSGPRELLNPESDPAWKTDSLELAPYGVLTTPQQSPPPFNTSPLSPHEQALSKGMEMLLTGDCLREEYARKATQRSTQFSRDRILKQWQELIQDTLSS